MRADEIAPKKLVVFDIDDTLVHTQTKVHVVKDGEIIDSLNSHDFTHYRLKPGEEFDFSGFRNAREFFEKSRPIIPMMNQLKRDIATGNKVVMVTARADFDDKELFLDTFRKFGIDIGKVHIYRAGNSKQGTTEERKKAIIKTLLDKDDYSKAIMYDDALPNLHTFMELKQDHPRTRFYAWHVSPEGEASEYMRESMVSEKRRRKSRWAAYGPGPYGGYGYLTGYSGDGGGAVGESQKIKIDDLDTIVKSFVTSPEGQKYQQHDCKTVTRAFVQWADQNGIYTEVITLAPPSAEFIEKNPRFRGKSGEGDGHIMPVVAGNAIDFTVRQFGINRPFEQPLITPMNSIKSVYGRFGYFTDAPEWFLGGKSHWIGPLRSIPPEIFNQDFGDELLERDIAEGRESKITVKPSPGKGNGLFATKLIKAGDVITSSKFKTISDKDWQLIKNTTPVKLYGFKLGDKHALQAGPFKFKFTDEKEKALWDKTEFKDLSLSGFMFINGADSPDEVNSKEQFSDTTAKMIATKDIQPGEEIIKQYNVPTKGVAEGRDLTELNVAATLKFIKDAHGDQLYGRMPYWQHPRAVALTGRKIFGSRFNSDAVKAAFLHDVVEDTGTELSDLKELGFSDRVIEAVRLLTKDTSLTYFQNIDRIIRSGNEIAQMVKYADNYENYISDKSDWDSDRASSSNKKYLKSLNKLGDHLGTKHHIDEASYEGNIGAMEVAKFYQKATDEEKKTLKDLINKKKLGLAWHLIQKVTGVKLQGKEFQEDHTAEVVLDTGEKKRLRYQPTNKDIVDVIINYYLKQGVKVLKVNGEEIEWDDTVKEGFQQRSIDKLMALGMQGPYSKRDLVGINRAWSNTLKGVQSSQIMVQDPDNPRHSAWISPDQSGRWIVGAEDGYAIKSGPQALQQLKFFLKVDEAWSEKYKRSINCSDPKGFSQRAHCQGRKKNEDGVVQEYEQDTKRSKEIEAVLKKAGYKFKGGGAEATAWSKDDGRVIKIIMPDENIINTKPAMKSFKRFYKLTKDSPNRHWPKFYPMKDELGQESEYAKFRIDNRKYMQISMEHLFELSDYEKELIEEMSSAVVDGKEYEDFISEILPVIKKYYPKVYLVAKKLGEQMPTLYTAMELAYRRSSWKYEWDLHGGNAMKRGDGIVVITDPFIRWAT